MVYFFEGHSVYDKEIERVFEPSGHAKIQHRYGLTRFCDQNCGSIGYWWFNRGFVDKSTLFGTRVLFCMFNKN